MNSFTELIAQAGGGQLQADLTEAVKEIVRAIRDTGKPGKLTLTIDIKPNNHGSVILLSKIVKKIPEHSSPQSIFFALDDGSLSRSDPNQIEMNLRDITKLKETK